MAAFSYPHHPVILDSVFIPNNTPVFKMSGLMDHEQNNNINSNIGFSQFCPSDQNVHGIHESSCLDHSSKVAFSDNEPSVTKKQSTESSTVVDKLESGEQVTQKVTLMDKKRKNRNGSFSNSAQSKVNQHFERERKKKRKKKKEKVQIF